MIVEDSIRIEAPTSVVWTVTMDVDRWPEWTPTVRTVRRLDGHPLAVGSVVRIDQPMQPRTDWTVTVLEPERVFSWRTVRRGLTLVATHTLRADGAATRNTLSVEASGAWARVLAPLLRPALRRALRAENEGLAARCLAEARRSG